MMGRATDPLARLREPIRIVRISALLCCLLAPSVAAGERGVGVAPERSPVFVDVAEASGVTFRHFSGATGEYYMPESYGSGVAVLDFDGDGDLDLYLVQSTLLSADQTLADALFPPPGDGPICDRLYRNDLAFGPRGERLLRFVDVTDRALLAACGYGSGVAVADVDNDGFPDLYLANWGSNQLWRNRGDGTFVDVTDRAGVDDERWSVAAAFLDYDCDGWLDLFVGNYAEFRVALHKECTSAAGYLDYCGPTSYRPVTDRLFHNQGDGSFDDATARAGLGRAAGYALGTIPADLDGDGWIDLYVANDGMENRLWINQTDGTFRDEALLAGCAVNGMGRPEASMGVDVADFDGDGDLDLFMTHLATETDTLYVNDGTGAFEDRSIPAGLGASSIPYTSFGTRFVDYDNDGWLDLLSVSGGVTVIPELVQSGDPLPFRQPDQLFRNLGDGRFEFVPPEVSGLTRVAMSRGAAFGDLDNDGDLDVAVSNISDTPSLLENRIGQDAPWMGFRLLATDLERDLLGSSVTVLREGRPPLRRSSRVAGSYASSNDPRVVVGLGSPSTVTEVEIEWADGRRQRMLGLPRERYLLLVTTSRPGTGHTAETGP